MSYRNASGYSDPTAGAVIPALTREQRMAAKNYRQLVFVASKDNGIEDAKRYCRFAVEQGYIPLAAMQHYAQVLDGVDDEHYTLSSYCSLILLSHCDELWVFDDENAENLEQLILKAERRNMPVRYFTIQCKERAE